MPLRATLIFVVYYFSPAPIYNAWDVYLKDWFKNWNIYSSQIIFIFTLARGIQKTLKVVWVDPRHEIEGRYNINLLLVRKRKRPCCSVWFPNSNLHASRSLCFSNLTSHCDPLGMQSLQQWLQKLLHLFTLFLSSALSSCHNCTVSRNGPLNICQATLECNLACG